MTQYGFRLFAVDLHLGMKHSAQKFGSAEIPIADKSAGMRQVHYPTAAAKDINRRLNKTDTFGLTTESDDGTTATQGRAVSMRFKHAVVSGDNLEMLLEHGLVNADGTVIDPQDDAADDIPLKNKSTLHPYRAILVCQPDSTRALVAVEARGNSCPIVSVIRGLNKCSEDNWRLRVVAHAVGEAAMLQFIKEASVKRVDFDKHDFEADGARERREVAMSVFTGIEGETVKAAAADWINQAFVKIRATVADKEAEFANADSSSTIKMSGKDRAEARKAAKAAKRDARAGVTADRREYAAQAARRVRQAIYLGPAEDVSIEFNGVGVEFVRGTEVRTVTPASVFKRYTYWLGNGYVPTAKFNYEAEKTARELLPLVQGLTLD
ncbi:hypothetical protein [Rhodococcus sp. IEGM1428]|uniref:hypothetical protein n=1 Tax=Rhodococcus sp. IEGM1428 TaxID=3392191 RepID=UPI003D14D17C